VETEEVRASVKEKSIGQREEGMRASVGKVNGNIEEVRESIKEERLGIDANNWAQTCVRKGER
jgi:hypothetical protein